jgi:hypothetical protein
MSIASFSTAKITLQPLIVVANYRFANSLLLN